MKKRGFTLIEAMMVIVILGIALPPFTVVTMNVLQQNIYSQAQATAVALAEGELERATGTRFSLVTNEAVATAFSAPFSAYTHQWVVDYVNAGALDTPVAGPTDYKRVKIQVANSIAGTVTITTLMTNDW